jgi:hypothetical protein
MMMAVYGGVAVVGQAVQSPSDKTAMMIHSLMVILVLSFDFTMSINEECTVNFGRFLILPP